MTENIEIKYKKGVKHENLAKRPKKQGLLVKMFLPTIAKMLMKTKDFTLTKVGMEDLDKNNTPYFMLFTHAQFIDMPIFLMAGWPRKSNNVAAIDSFRGMYGLLQTIGKSIPARKFGSNTALFRNAIHVITKNKSVFGIAAEAQYSSEGVTAILPESLGKMIKLLKQPVVTLNMHGNYANCPTWCDQKPRNEIPLRSVMTYALTPEDIEKMSVDEINAKIRTLLEYNDWKFWQDSNALVKYENRAVGLEQILYKCPECDTEF
ncbi:MAG: hypothetical protein LBH47_03845, partial [Christensenellaceae bacterium]|nr:hypothetical protein [Christensenellaceae bacterium]